MKNFSGQAKHKSFLEELFYSIKDVTNDGMRHFIALQVLTGIVNKSFSYLRFKKVEVNADNCRRKVFARLFTLLFCIIFITALTQSYQTQLCLFNVATF